MRESTIEQAAVDYATQLGYLHLKLNVKGRRGWPDQEFVRQGVVLFIEFKAPGEEPTELQKYIHRLLREHKMLVYVVDSIYQARAILEKHSGSTH